ncbi:Uncharacterized membrane protein [Dethiosulfatibacter aminovorans DSM 17477]|uniref:Uncharacterized membrane protein n=1 Tax=Dethiosulfatibacter aminovorans DSM 17477 TaxID=1121476 RepID=A0A1M6C8D2_9FIRM|nr:ECF transporter S component [Dethiosulfatibacter aminovorans]SHI57071.1 Uncharacterized membrane protein [Dethiosulfatibacter aminovorans DSM 17477]
MRENKTRIITLSALMAAVVYVATYIGTALPFSGYIHLGDAAVFLSGLLLGPHYGMLASVLGSAMADGLKGYVVYIPATVILKGAMAYITGLARNKNNSTIAGSMIVGGLVMVAGYYVYEAFLYSNLAAPLVSIPWNVLQFAVGIIIAMILIKPFSRFKI